MVQTNPTPFEVGRAFVHQYYTLLHRAPGLLHRFYSTDSTFVHGGVDRPGSVEQPAVGPENISKRISELNLRDCHAKIRQVDSHPTIGNGVVVQVTGELSNNGDPMRRFMQTFVLAPREPKKYYVQNDIFRYQDEVFDDGSDEDDRSSSQVYNDTDKVSNADSSSVMPMQPTMVEVQHQALPPRRAPEAPAPVELSPVNTFQNEGPATSETTSNANQTSKNANAEGASYAGIAAKLAAGAAPVAPPVAPAPTTVTPPSTVKSAPINRGNPSQRGTSEGYYRTNHRAYMGSESSDGPYRSSYSAVNQISAPNEQQVFVGSLPPNITREDLMKCFSQFGNVIDARINVFPNETRKSYGFVAFDDAATASMVVQKQHVLYGHHQLNVEQKTQKTYPNSTNNTGNMRHNYPSRGGRGMMSRGGYKNNPGGNPRRGGPAGGGQGYRQENFDENHPKIVNQS